MNTNKGPAAGKTDLQRAEDVSYLAAGCRHTDEG